MKYKQQMIRWRLSEVMARHKITGKALAEELDVRQESISNWKTSESMPRINGKKVELLLEALTKLAGQTIVFADLYEESQKPKANSQKPFEESQSLKENFNSPIPA